MEEFKNILTEEQSTLLEEDNILGASCLKDLINPCAGCTIKSPSPVVLGAALPIQDNTSLDAPAPIDPPYCPDCTNCPSNCRSDSATGQTITLTGGCTTNGYLLPHLYGDTNIRLTRQGLYDYISAVGGTAKSVTTYYAPNASTTDNKYAVTYYSATYDKAYTSKTLTGRLSGNKRLSTTVTGNYNSSTDDEVQVGSVSFPGGVITGITLPSFTINSDANWDGSTSFAECHIEAIVTDGAYNGTNLGSSGSLYTPNDGPDCTYTSPTINVTKTLNSSGTITFYLVCKVRIENPDMNYLNITTTATFSTSGTVTVKYKG